MICVNRFLRLYFHKIAMLNTGDNGSIPGQGRLWGSLWSFDPLASEVTLYLISKICLHLAAQCNDRTFSMVYVTCTFTLLHKRSKGLFNLQGTVHQIEYCTLIVVLRVVHHLDNLKVFFVSVPNQCQLWFLAIIQILSKHLSYNIIHITRIIFKSNLPNIFPRVCCHS